ncbi:MAG: hypothetical protein H2038_09210 [Brevundimonas sp.]|uniref:hypothetical protein n=1 Tax=Brevundimonas sp. TaxID=1871086 RepID=UPI0018341DF2|nr:hypothetical protein [Brevundimonas sp.]MBA4804813.1 hypothetical protein [Brevundimonas sp.]
MLLAMLGVVLLAAGLAPPGSDLRRLLVEAPARRLQRVRPGHVLFFCALAVIGGLLFWLFEAEGLRFFSLMAPDVVVWFAVFDISLYLDVVVLGAALSATTRVRALSSVPVRMVARRWRRARAGRSPRRARGKAPAGARDESGGPARPWRPLSFA